MLEYTFYSRESFKILISLLNYYELPAVQLCAVWDIHFLCALKREIFKKYYIFAFHYEFHTFFLMIAEEYREMLIEINGHKIIKEIYEKTTNDSLKSFCEQTLKTFHKEYPDLNY
jgi:hypothetical protein